MITAFASAYRKNWPSVGAVQGTAVGSAATLASRGDASTANEMGPFVTATAVVGPLDSRG